MGRGERHEDPSGRLERLERLQALTGALSAAAAPEDVTRIMLDQGLALLGARGMTLYWERLPGELELLNARGASEAFLRRYRRVSVDAPLPGTEAFRTGQPVWLGSPEALSARFPEVAGLVLAEGDQAWAALPLIGDRSRGALGLRFATRRAFAAEDRELFVAVATQCAQALERARLHEAQRRQAERLRQIQSTTAALSGAATPRGVAEAAFRGLEVMGARAAEIHALEGPERLVALASWRGGATAPAAAPESPEAPGAPESPVPAGEVIRTGKALWLESPEEIDRRFPELEAARRARGEAAWAVVPLLAGGVTVGALAVAFGEAHRFDPEEKAFIRMLAGPCAQALERARLHEAAARQRADAEAASATLEALLGAAPVALALLDGELRFRRANERLVALDGVAADAHLGRTPAEVLRGVAGAQLEAAARQVIEAGAPAETRLTGELPGAPGLTRRLAVTAYPVRVAGKLVGVGVALREA